MPRFFQHIDKSSGDLGKVTRLKYIDDVSDPDMILYHFEDGSYCNSEFIAPYDTQEPLNSMKVMIEVPSPNSLWQFKKREKLNLDTEKRVAIGQDGNIYEAPPMFDKNGKNIGPDSEKEDYDIIRAPRIPANYKQEPDDVYSLSVHPELSANPEQNQPVAVRPATAKVKPAKAKTSPVEQPAENFDFDEEKILEVQTADSVHEHQKALIESLRAEINTLKAANEKLKNELSTREPADDPNEDPFIRSMVLKSKKKPCRITLGIKFDLPPKEVYDTIKNAYEDGMAEAFISSLTARIPRESLLQSLNDGLKKYYEGTSQKKDASSDASEKPN